MYILFSYICVQFLSIFLSLSIKNVDWNFLIALSQEIKHNFKRSFKLLIICYKLQITCLDFYLNSR